MLNNDKILFIVNPISGVKNNRFVANTVIKVLDQHQISFDIIYTPNQGYAKTYVYNMDAKLYRSLLILGGDGTINEILNGILSREDGYLPTFGFLPGGTSARPSRFFLARPSRI